MLWSKCACTRDDRNASLPLSRSHKLSQAGRHTLVVPNRQQIAETAMKLQALEEKVTAELNCKVPPFHLQITLAKTTNLKEIGPEASMKLDRTLPSDV